MRVFVSTVKGSGWLGRFILLLLATRCFHVIFTSKLSLDREGLAITRFTTPHRACAAVS